MEPKVGHYSACRHLSTQIEYKGILFLSVCSLFNYYWLWKTNVEDGSSLMPLKTLSLIRHYHSKQPTVRGPFDNHVKTLIPAWISNYTRYGMKLLIHSQTSMVQPLRFGNGYVISSHMLLGMWLLIHISKRGPRDPMRHCSISELDISKAHNSSCHFLVALMT